MCGVEPASCLCLEALIWESVVALREVSAGSLAVAGGRWRWQGVHWRGALAGCVFAPFGGSGIPSGGTGCDLVSSGGAGSCLPLPRDASQSVARNALGFSIRAVEGLLRELPPSGTPSPPSSLVKLRQAPFATGASWNAVAKRERWWPGVGSGGLGSVNGTHKGVRAQSTQPRPSVPEGRLVWLRQTRVVSWRRTLVVVLERFHREANVGSAGQLSRRDAQRREGSGTIGLGCVD